MENLENRHRMFRTTITLVSEDLQILGFLLESIRNVKSVVKNILEAKFINHQTGVTVNLTYQPRDIERKEINRLFLSIIDKRGFTIELNKLLSEFGMIEEKKHCSDIFYGKTGKFNRDLVSSINLNLLFLKSLAFKFLTGVESSDKYSFDIGDDMELMLYNEQKRILGLDNDVKYN